MGEIYEGRGLGSYFKLGESINKVLACVQLHDEVFGPIVFVNSTIAPSVSGQNTIS